MANKTMHHMIHGDDTYEIVDSAARKVTLSEPVNVLSLGVKNDGSADCSSIINAATENYELYFPSGAYRVDNPLYIKKSIYGSGASRDFQRRNVSSGARFVSYIDATSSSSNYVGVVNIINGSADVIGIGIVCYSNEDGIYFNPASAGETIKIQNVTVYNIGNSAGMRFGPTKRDSRAVYIDNCSIFGRGAESNSIGIIFNDGTYDSIVNNCEIMAVHVGIISYVGTNRYSNVHIWTGLLGGQTPDPWWPGTIGMHFYSSAYCTNVYIDSSFIAVAVESVWPVAFYNTTIWNDNSMSESANYNGTVFYAAPSIITNANIIVDGCTIYDNGRIKYLTTTAIRQSPSKFSNIILFSDKENVPTNLVTGYVGRLYPSDEFAIIVDAGKYVEVANIAAQYGGVAEIDCSLDNDRSIVDYSKTSRFTLTKKLGNLRMYYKEYQDDNSIACYKVYVYNSGASGQTAVVRRHTSGNAYMTSYNTLDVTNQQRVMPEVLSSADGLTEIVSA